MSIFKIARTRNFQTVPPEILKPGQIIQGKIKKIFRNNNAQIKFGNKIVTAQVKTSLLVGERYYFQVESLGDRIQLKVINNHSNENIRNLVSYLGLNNQKRNYNFIQFLMNHYIPFTQKQIKAAVTLLDSVSDKKVAQYILRYMISENMPITESTFNALYTVETKKLSEQIHIVLEQLFQKEEDLSPVEQQLINRLYAMTRKGTDVKEPFIRYILYEGKENSRYLFNFLTATGIIEIGENDFSRWQSEWGIFARHHSTRASDSYEQIPFNLNIEKSIEALLFLRDHQQQLQQTAHKLLNRWFKNPMTANHFTLFKQEINETIAPFFSKFPISEFMQTMQNNRTHQKHILSILQTLADDHSYMKIEEILLMTTNESDNLLPPREMFLNQLKRMLLFVGLTDENLIVRDQINRTSPSIKLMLMQLIQNNDPVLTEKAQHLLHFINGLQLQSIDETNHFIYTSFQIPGEKLHLNDDLRLEFTSKKTEDGKINPNYCRILFYLNLKNLKETIIDMHIQNRLISITIFNDQEKIKDQCTLFQPLLKARLKDYNYVLTNVNVKPLRKRTSSNKMQSVMENLKTDEGIDYRI